jgi:hypothetical protein
MLDICMQLQYFEDEMFENEEVLLKMPLSE